MDIIEALKNNEKAFGLMTAEMQAKAKDIKYDARNNPNFDYFNDGADWVIADSPDFGRNRTYRLRPDYKEEPAIIECEVLERKGWLCVERPIGHDPYTAMDSCIAHPDFVGFLYKDGIVRTDARTYRCDDQDGTHYRVEFDNLKSGLVRVLTPTHVLFRKGE